MSVTVEGCPIPEVAEAGLVGYLLVARFLEFSRAGVSSTLPIQQVELPADEYNAYVYGEHLDLYGEGTLQVVPGEIQGYRLACRQPRYVWGIVAGPDGTVPTGAVVRVLDEWPPEVERHWGQSGVDEEGRFRLLVPSAAGTRVELEVVWQGRVSSHHAMAGEGMMLTLPDVH